MLFGRVPSSSETVENRWLILAYATAPSSRSRLIDIAPVASSTGGGEASTKFDGRGFECLFPGLGSGAEVASSIAPLTGRAIDISFPQGANPTIELLPSRSSPRQEPPPPCDPEGVVVGPNTSTTTRP